MKALQIDRTGALDVLTIRDVADPSPSENEVLLRIEAAGVNPSDVGIALGRFPRLVLPRILGRDFAGTVIEGSSDLVGKPVWGTGGGELGLTRDGAHAEMLSLPVSAVALRPDTLTAESAAAIGTPLLAAWSSLVELAHLASGEWVVVSGAAGAVGLTSVQIAKALSAHPIALVLSSDDVSELEQIGVDAIVRSDRDDLAAVVHKLTGGTGAHVATNAVGSPLFATLVEALGEGGRMVIFSARAGRVAEFDLFTFYRKRLTFYGLDTAAFTLDHTAEILRQADPLLGSGKLGAPKITARYPLVKARDAYERVNAGDPGKVLIIP